MDGFACDNPGVFDAVEDRDVADPVEVLSGVDEIIAEGVFDAEGAWSANVQPGVFDGRSRSPDRGSVELHW